MSIYIHPLMLGWCKVSEAHDLLHVIFTVVHFRCIWDTWMVLSENNIWPGQYHWRGYNTPDIWLILFNNCPPKTTFDIKCIQHGYIINSSLEHWQFLGQNLWLQVFKSKWQNFVSWKFHKIFECSKGFLHRRRGGSSSAPSSSASFCSLWTEKSRFREFWSC